MKTPDISSSRICLRRQRQSEVVIQIEGLTKQYALSGSIIEALRHIDLVVSRNEYLAVMGQIGRAHV